MKQKDGGRIQSEERSVKRGRRLSVVFLQK